MRPLSSALIACACVAAGCHGAPDPAFTQLLEARRVASELHVQFIKAAGASDRAVLADTDEASVAFAREAEAASQTVQTDLAELGTLLQHLGYQLESQQLDELSRRFAESRKVDRDVLALAVENTNLKAQRLAFGPVREAADAFRAALEAAGKAAPAKDRCRADAEVARAVLAVREIQILQAPHIAEEQEAAMSALEAQMSERQTAARGAMAALVALAPAARAPLGDAEKAFARFGELSAQLVALSRRNTNVRSLALALRQMPALTAACDASLTALEQSLAKRGFTGTR
jgi:hypothetical protein